MIRQETLAVINGRREDEMLKHQLLEPLLACTEEEINDAYEYMDDWTNNSNRDFTLELFYAIFPQFSGGESEVIFNSWLHSKKTRLPI